MFNSVAVPDPGRRSPKNELMGFVEKENYGHRGVKMVNCVHPMMLLMPPRVASLFGKVASQFFR